MDDTIFALSSGAPPAAVAILRISGPQALMALAQLAGSAPSPRRAALRTLRDNEGEVLDRALVIGFPGPASATGEDCVELHCHGGRAVVAAVTAALREVPGLREALPGEFTRRAFENGVIDLAQAEALGDLLSAETELQRRAAQAGVGGALGADVDRWREEVLALSALAEASLDFSDDEDAEELSPSYVGRVHALREALQDRLERPRAERLRDGIRVVFAGPPNFGKSSLFNALLGEGAAIVSPIAGTTRDVVERPVALAGVPFVLVDTAGLRSDSSDQIEAIGINRAVAEVERADIVLWLGPEGEGPPDAIEIEAKADLADRAVKQHPDHRVSSATGLGLATLTDDLVSRARTLLPLPGSAAINARQAELLTGAVAALDDAMHDDILLAAEALRNARVAFDRLLGRSGVEDMLDRLFAGFCIGK